MRRVRLGRSDLEVSVICLGTMTWGTQNAEAEGHAQLDRALERGVNFLDTAEMYPVNPVRAETIGRTEEIIGSWIGRTGRRGDWVIATKITGAGGKARGDEPITGAAVPRALEGSLRRLRTDVIDLYQLHWPNPFVPLRTQARALATILDAGIARQAGVSNHSLAGWQAIERALARPIVSNQVNFSLVAPSAATELVPYARDHGRVIIAYSPLGQGLLARTDPGRPRDIRRFSRQYSAAGLRRTAALRAAVADIARAHGATPAQVALAWLIAHGNVIVIPGAHSVAQLEENAAASDLDLSDAELARLTALAGR